MFAFDVIGEITFSHRLGFLEQGRDVDGIMANIWNTFRQTSLVRECSCIFRAWIFRAWIFRACIFFTLVFS